MIYYRSKPQEFFLIKEDNDIDIKIGYHDKDKLFHNYNMTISIVGFVFFIDQAHDKLLKQIDGNLYFFEGCGKYILSFISTLHGFKLADKISLSYKICRDDNICNTSTVNKSISNIFLNSNWSLQIILLSIALFLLILLGIFMRYIKYKRSIKNKSQRTSDNKILVKETIKTEITTQNVVVSNRKKEMKQDLIVDTTGNGTPKKTESIKQAQRIAIQAKLDKGKIKKTQLKF